MTRMIRSALCLMALGCFALVARAGVVIQQEGGEVGGNKPKGKITLYLDAGKLRVENQDKSVMIFNGEKQVVWMIGPGENTYRELDKAQMEAMGQQMSQAMQQMQAQLATMPPEQRKMVEEMMKKNMGGGAAERPTTTVKEIGSGEKVGPYTTTHYEMLANGERTQEIWAAPADQAHISAADIKTFQDMSKFFEALSRNAPKGSWSAPSMEQIKGFPVKTVQYDRGRPAYEWSIVSVEQKSVDGNLFTLPPGIKKQDMMPPGMGMRRGQ
jgi:uncharacterized protein DUF4412